MPGVLDLPVADPWFVVGSAGDGVSLVTEPHVHPLLRCNVWHVRGRDVDLVVDTSLGLRPLRHLVEHELDHELLAVATHVHGDHIGGMHEFDQRAIHVAEADELAAAGRVTVDTAQYGPRVLGPYLEAGYEVGDLLVDAVPLGGLAAATLDRARRRRPGCSTTATSSTSAIGPSRSSTCPVTPPAASGCGRRRAACCSPATPSTTGRCSTSSTAPTSPPTSRRCAGCASCR